MIANTIKQFTYVILTYDTDTGTFNLLFSATNTLTTPAQELGHADN